MKYNKFSKHQSRKLRVFAPVHINSKGVIDYKLPLCDLMDSILCKRSFSTSAIMETLDGSQYYYEYNFDGKSIVVYKNLIIDEFPGLKLIEKHKGDFLEKEFNNGSFNFILYKDSIKIMDTISYQKDLDLNADMVIEVGSYFYKLPLCEFIDNTIAKIPDLIKVIYFGFEGDRYYIILEFNGKDITYTRYSINNSNIDKIESYVGDRLVKEFSGHNNILLSLYEGNNRKKDIFSYSIKF